LGYETGHVGLHGLLQREGRHLPEGLASNRAVLEIADCAVDPMAGVGVENHLALDPEILDDPRCHIFRYLVRPVDTPELRDHHMGLGVMEAPRTKRAPAQHGAHAVPDRSL